MATTFRSLRQTLGLATGFLRTFSATSDGAAGGTTVISTTLTDESNDYYNGWWVYALLATPAYKRVSDFVASSGTLTTAAFASQVVNTTACELWRYNPAYVDEAIKRTLEAIYPRLHKRFINETLITGNILRDPNLEEWSSTSAMVHWAKSGANLTLAQESTTKLYGAYSAKLTADAATQYLYQSGVEAPSLLDLAGHSADFRAWAYTATASHARLQVVTTDKDGTSVTSNSLYHAGDSRWHLLEKTDVSIPSNLRSIQFRLTADVNAGVAYFDQARVYGPSVCDYYLPRSGSQHIQRLEIQTQRVSDAGDEDLDPCDDQFSGWPYGVVKARIDDNGTDKILRLGGYAARGYGKWLGGSLARGYRMRLIGASLLTVPATDTATTELDSPLTEYLLAEAAVRFYGMAPEGIPKEDVDRFAKEQGRWLVIAERLRRQHEMVLPPSNLQA